MASIRLATLTILGMLLLTPGQAAAQVFGTFSWPMLPFCNKDAAGLPALEATPRARRRR